MEEISEANVKQSTSTMRNGIALCIYQEITAFLLMLELTTLVSIFLNETRCRNGTFSNTYNFLPWKDGLKKESITTCLTKKNCKIYVVK